MPRHHLTPAETIARVIELEATATSQEQTARALRAEADKFRRELHTALPLGEHFLLLPGDTEEIARVGVTASMISINAITLTVGESFQWPDAAPFQGADAAEFGPRQDCGGDVTVHAHRGDCTCSTCQAEAMIAGVTSGPVS